MWNAKATVTDTTDRQTRGLIVGNGPSNCTASAVTTVPPTACQSQMRAPRTGLRANSDPPASIYESAGWLSRCAEITADPGIGLIWSWRREVQTKFKFSSSPMQSPWMWLFSMNVSVYTIRCDIFTFTQIFNFQPPSLLWSERVKKFDSKYDLFTGSLFTV